MTKRKLAVGQTRRAAELPPAAVTAWGAEAERLRARRVAIGLTQRQLADIMSLSGSGEISVWETCESVPRVATWLRWRIALGLSPMPGHDPVAELDRQFFAGLRAAGAAERRRDCGNGRVRGGGRGRFDGYALEGAAGAVAGEEA